MKLFFRLLGTTIIAILILSACAPKPAAVRPPLRIEWTPWPGDYPIAIAKELGIFEKHGIQVEPVRYDVFSDAMPDIASGKLDGGLFVIGDLLMSSQNDNLRGVLVTDVSDGADQVVAISDIQSLADLRGKRIGVKPSTFGELFVREMLKSASISPDEVTLVDIDAEKIPDAIPALVEAGHTWEPYTSQAIQKGEHVIFTSAQTPGLLPDLLTIRTQIVNERPEDVRALIEAWLEAVQYWHDNPEAGNAIIAKFANMKPEEISSEGVKLYTLKDNIQTYQQGTNTTSIYYATQLNLDFLVKTGNITYPINIDRVLDPSFVTEISKAKP